MKTKICHFSSVHSTGDTRIFYRECLSLTKEYKVTLVGIGEFTGISHQVKVIGIPKPGSRTERFLFTIWKVFYKALSVNAQVYHLHDPEMIPFGILFSILGKKVIYDVHENTSGDILHKEWIPPLLRLPLYFVYRVMEWIASWFLHFILVIAKPDYAGKFFYPVNNSSIIQNFANSGFLKPYLVANRSELAGDHLLYSGTMDNSYYRFKELIEAICILKNGRRRIILHCIGSITPSFINRLKEIEAWGEVKEQVLFYQNLPFPEACEISKRCKIGICLKDQPSEILVSQERKFFEYMALGLPMLCCNALIYAEIVQKYKLGITVDLTNSKSMAKGIASLLDDPISLKNMQHACLQAVQNSYNWQSQELILLNLYGKLTGRDPHIRSVFPRALSERKTPVIPLRRNTRINRSPKRV